MISIYEVLFVAAMRPYLIYKVLKYSSKSATRLFWKIVINTATTIYVNFITNVSTR